MSHVRMFSGLMGCVIASCSFAGSPLGFIPDIEPDNELFATAPFIVFPATPPGCSRMIGGVGEIGPFFDLDRFRITLSQGDRICIVATPLDGLPAGFATPEIQLELHTLSGAIIFGTNQSGTAITTGPVASGGAVLRFCAEVSSTYQILVQGNGGTGGRYQLSVLHEVPSCVGWTESSNGLPQEADIVDLRRANPIAISGMTSPGDDDYFALDLQVGDVVTAAAIASTSILNFNHPDMILGLSDGVNVLGVNTSDGPVNFPDYPSATTGATVFFRAPYSGRFYIIASSSSSGTGKYTLFMSLVPASQCEGDADGNGIVNFADITAVLKFWNIACN